VISRRQLLKGLAALPATLAFARRLGASDVTPPPKRLVLFMQNNGTQQANFWPQGAGLRSPILDALCTDENGAENGLRAKTTVVKGVYVPSDLNGTSGNQHDMGFARMFTGERLISSGGQPWGGAASVDQILARQWNLDSLTLAVLTSQIEPHPKPGFDHRESFCYLGPATIKHPRRDPLDVYRYLFEPVPSAGRRLSVLDAVRGNLMEVHARLGASERHKLEYHLTAIDDVRAHILGHRGQCAAQPAPPPDYLALSPNSELSDDTYIPNMIDDMIDLAVLALQCDVTRIATVQLGYGGGKWQFAWKGINLDFHRDCAHNDTSDAGSTPENTQRVVLANQYYASCVGRLAAKLDAIPEGSGTMLDNTLVVWANEQGRGDHSQQNLPIVLVGRAGGWLPTGGRVVDRGMQPFNRLGCTILNAMGMPAAGFGDVPDCGVFQGI
jgi:uncharacterized protein DUF1552